MSANIRSDSGDAYHAWEDVKCDRQAYATYKILEFQRLTIGHRPIPFDVLVEVFRRYGEEFDEWTAQRAEEMGRAA